MENIKRQKSISLSEATIAQLSEISSALGVSIRAAAEILIRTTGPIYLETYRSAFSPDVVKLTGDQEKLKLEEKPKPEVKPKPKPKPKPEAFQEGLEAFEGFTELIDF